MRLSEEAERVGPRAARPAARPRADRRNEAACTSLLPLIARFREQHPAVHVDVRRVPARQVGVEVAQGSLDFGVLTFQPPSKRLHADHARPRRARDAGAPVASARAARAGARWRSSRSETVIAHNDPSPARDRVLRLFEQRHAPINIQIALPSLEGIKRAVEMKMGVALLPRRCALAEIARGQLVAVRIPRCGCRGRCGWSTASGELSHAAPAFLDVAKDQHRRPTLESGRGRFT